MSRLLRAWRGLRGGAIARQRLPVRPLQLPDIAASSSASHEIAVGESLEWLNTTFEGLWPKVNAATQKLVHGSVTRRIQDQMPGILKNTHFDEFTLGACPPVLGPVKVYQTNGSIRMTLGVDYQSDVDISLQVGPASVGVRSLRFSGELVVRLEQLVEQLPVIGGVVIYFINPPRVDFTFTGIGRAIDLPGLSGILRRALDNAISSSLVLPNQLAIPIGTEAQGVDRADMMLAKPLGLLRVRAVSAEGLRGPDWEDADKETADAYVVVKTANERWESSTVEASCDPEWLEDEHGDLFVYDHEQRLWASVLDHASGDASDFIGASHDLLVRHALAEGQCRLSLFGTEHIDAEDEAGEEARGELSLDVRFLEFEPEELCGDTVVLCVKVGTLSLPPDFAGQAQLLARVGGVSKATPVGREVREHEGSVVVNDLLRDVIRRSAEKGLSKEDIAEITALDAQDVVSVLEGGQVAEDAVLAKTRRLIRVEACLFFALPAEILESGAVELIIASREGQPLASTEVPLADVAGAEHFTIADLHSMPSEEQQELEAHVSLILMGTREAAQD